MTFGFTTSLHTSTDEALARLRNLLVHRYWAIRDDIVYSNVKTNFRCVNEFIEKVRRLIGT